MEYEPSYQLTVKVVEIIVSVVDLWFHFGRIDDGGSQGITG